MMNKQQTRICIWAIILIAMLSLCWVSIEKKLSKSKSNIDATIVDEFFNVLQNVHLVSINDSPDRSIIKGFLELQNTASELDQTAWVVELAAQNCGKYFIQLWNALNRNGQSKDLVFILKKFPFSNLIFPQTIEVEKFELKHSISFDEWVSWIQRKSKQGWSVTNSEWRHIEFEPSAKSDSPGGTSRFEFRLNIIQNSNLSSDSNTYPRRISVHGFFKVNWELNPSSLPTEIIPSSIKIENWTLVDSDSYPEIRSFSLTQDLKVGTDSKTERWAYADPLIAIDIDNDKDIDLLLPGANHFWENNSLGKFNLRSLFNHPLGFLYSAVVEDWNRDGNWDLFAANLDGVWLFEGSGAGQFTSRPRLLWKAPETLQNPYCLTVGDFNQDGNLDLWLGQYKLPFVGGQMPTPWYDANDGFPCFVLAGTKSGTLTDITSQIDELHPFRFRRYYSGSWIDLDSDGDLDLCLVSDFAGAEWWENLGPSTSFTLKKRPLDFWQGFGMGQFFGDFNKDGNLDWWVTGMHSPTADRLSHLKLHASDSPETELERRKQMSYGSRLFLQQNQGSFIQPDWMKLVARNGWAWGIAPLDLDNDGDLDFYVTNGHKSGPSVRDFDSEFWTHDIYLADSTSNPAVELYQYVVGRDRFGSKGWSYGGYDLNRLWKQSGTEAVKDLAFLYNLADGTDSRNVVSGDWNSDGWLDLAYVTETIWPKKEVRLKIFTHPGVTTNKRERANSWIGFHLQPGNTANWVGARLEAHFKDSGIQPMKRWVTGGDSFRSQSQISVHFGFGDRQIDELSHFEAHLGAGKIAVKRKFQLNHWNSWKP